MAAFTLNSNTNHTTASVKYLFDFLSDFKNFAAILPEDKVENFQYDGNQCSFNIRGITPMTIKLIEKTPYSGLLFSSEGLAKFNFSLKVDFEGAPELPGQCAVHLSGDLNPIIKAMAEKPLQTLVNTMSLKLSQLNSI
ncbi:MAG: hypothetical protein IT236_04095 [Bacteroidia bacterium]|nr:hypothetical protein [Bacteroidia bacterium]